MSLSEKIKGIHNQILELGQCPDQYQTCQEYYFDENSRTLDLVSKILLYCERFSEKYSKYFRSKQVLQNHLRQTPNLVQKHSI